MTLQYAAQCPTCGDTARIYVRFDGDLVCLVCAGINK